VRRRFKPARKVSASRRCDHRTPRIGGDTAACREARADFTAVSKLRGWTTAPEGVNGQGFSFHSNLIWSRPNYTYAMHMKQRNMGAVDAQFCCADVQHAVLCGAP
jgi:hypothetical protein